MKQTNLQNKNAYLLIHADNKVAVSETPEGLYSISGYYLQTSDEFNAKDMLYLQCKDGTKLVTTSGSFIKSFAEILDIFGDADLVIEIKSETSRKNGKKYMLCTWHDTSND